MRQDVELAEQVIAHDDTVDDYFERVKQALIHRIANDPAEGGTALDLLMIAKYLERIGDMPQISPSGWSSPSPAYTRRDDP